MIRDLIAGQFESGIADGCQMSGVCRERVLDIIAPPFDGLLGQCLADERIADFHGVVTIVPNVGVIVDTVCEAAPETQREIVFLRVRPPIAIPVADESMSDEGLIRERINFGILS